MSMQNTVEYRLIAREWKGLSAKRSGMPYINHVDEGVQILEMIGASDTTQRAFCLHALVQADADLVRNYDLIMWAGNRDAAVLAMEYRHIANGYLSNRDINSIGDIKLSPLPEIQQMLIADKLQNNKDFRKYLLGKIPNSDRLEVYFANWFKRLEITENLFVDTTDPIMLELKSYSFW